MTGISMSKVTMSGCTWVSFWTAMRPFGAVPTTSMSGRCSAHQ